MQLTEHMKMRMLYPPPKLYQDWLDAQAPQSLLDTWAHMPTRVPHCMCWAHFWSQDIELVSYSGPHLVVASVVTLFSFSMQLSQRPIEQRYHLTNYQH